MCAPSLSCCSVWPKPQQCNLSLSSSQNLREDPGLLLNLLCFLYSGNYTTQCQFKLMLNNAFKPALILLNITNTPGIIVICCMFAPKFEMFQLFSPTCRTPWTSAVRSSPWHYTWLRSPREELAGLTVQSSIEQQFYKARPEKIELA